MPIRYSSFVISETTVLYIDELTITFCLLVHYGTIFILWHWVTAVGTIWHNFSRIIFYTYYGLTLKCHNILDNPLAHQHGALGLDPQLRRLFLITHDK